MWDPRGDVCRKSMGVPFEDTHASAANVCLPKTRDCQVKMTKATVITIPDDVHAALRVFDDDYLADVFRVWNCDTQNWFDSTTAIFRFEKDDLLVWCEMGCLRAKQGAVVTQNIIEAESESCLIWMSDPTFSDLFGERNLSSTLLDYFRDS